MRNVVLMRNWTPSNLPEGEEWVTHNQIVVHSVYQDEVLKITQDNHMSGHYGISKKCEKVMISFYWPKIRTISLSFVKLVTFVKWLENPTRVFR